MFAAKRADGRPVWKVIYDHIVGSDPEIGHLFEHDELRMQLQPKELRHYYAAIGTTARHLEQLRQRTLVSVRRSGYRYVGGVGQISKGMTYRQRSQSALTRGTQIIDTTDFEMLTPVDRSWADRQRNAMVALLSIVKQHDEKLIKISQDVDILNSYRAESVLRQKESESEIAQLRDRIEELERARAS